MTRIRLERLLEINMNFKPNNKRSISGTEEVDRLWT